MVKKLVKCILLNKAKSNVEDSIQVVKYGHARNLLMKKKGCVLVSKNLNAVEIADKKIFTYIKVDLEKAKEAKDLELSVKANKSGTLYESLSVSKIMSSFKSKKGLNNINIFSIRLESTEGVIQDVKTVGDYSLKLYYCKEEITCVSLKVKASA